jgi:hypothetical protein
MQHRDKSQLGSVFVELLWTIPLFISGIVLIILVGIHLNAKSALQDAVTQGLSLASTRGYAAQLLSSSPLMRATKYIKGQNSFTDIKDLVVSASKSDLSEEVLLDAYESALGGGGLELKDLQNSQILALVYVNQAISLASLGEAVFPCAAGEETMGCLRCFFVPTRQGVLPLAIDDRILSDLSSSSYGNADVINRHLSQRLEMWCSYRPKNFFLTAAMGIAQASGFNISSQLGTIQVKGAVDAFAGF